MKWLINSKIRTSSDRLFLIDWTNDGASSLEIRFRDLIKPFWKNFLVLFQTRIPMSLLRIDFLNVNKKIAVEINGRQHSKYTKFFHTNRNGFLQSIKRDMEKLKICEQNNIKLLELEEEDLDNFSLEYIKEKFGVSLI